MFITFEGCDGSGKTTTLKKLHQFLKTLPIDFILTREPGGANSDESAQIRQIILNNHSQITDMTEAILYSADRRLNLEKNIWPALKANKIVLCDRYIDSSFAYQAYGRQLGFEKIKILQDLITEKTYPDLTIFFDVLPNVAQKRVNERSKSQDRLEQTDEAFKKRVYEGYQEIIKMFPERFVVIDASLSKTEVFNKVKETVLHALKLD